MDNSEAGAAQYGSRLRIDLTAALPDGLLPAISEHAQQITTDDPWAARTLTRPDKVEELDPSEFTAAGDGTRVFSFRKVERKLDGTSTAKWEPLTREVIVELHESGEPNEWVVHVRPDPILRPDPTMRRESRWPEARYDSRSAVKVRQVASTLASAPLITEIRAEEIDPTSDGTTTPVGNTSKLTVTMWDKSSFDVVASIDPVSGRLTLTADDGTSHSEQLRIDGGISVLPGLSAKREVERVLPILLRPLVAKHLGYPDVPRDGASYLLTDSGELRPTTAGFSRYAAGIHAMRLHRMQFVPHRYLRDTIHDAIDELQLRKGQPNFELHRNLANAEAPETKALYVKHGGRWRRHAPAWTDSYGRSFSVTVGRVLLRQVDNFLAGRLSPNPDQRDRYTAAVISGLLRPTYRGHFRVRQRGREGSETVPIHLLAHDRLWPHLALDLTSGLFDVTGRLGADELAGGSTDPTLQAEIGARRFAQTPFTAVRDWKVDPSWLPAGTFERQAVNVAGRTEAVGEFSDIGAKYRLIREALTVVLADPSIDAEARQKLLTTVIDFHRTFQRTWDLIVKHDLRPGAFQTKEGPVRLAPLRKRLVTNGLPALGGLGAGVAIGGWAFGYLGVPPFLQQSASILTGKQHERLKADERAKIRKVDAEVLFEAERERQVEFERKLAVDGRFTGGYEPLSVKFRRATIKSDLPGTAVQLGVAAPAAAGALAIPELRELAIGLIINYSLSPIGSAVDSFLHRYLDHRFSEKEQRLWHEIAVAEKAPIQLLRSPEGVASLYECLTTELTELMTRLSTLHDRIDNNFTREKLPPLPEPLAAVREAVLAHGSLVEAEYFQRATETIKESPDAIGDYLAELVPEFHDLPESDRPGTAANEFRAETERRFLGLAEAELAGKFMAEHLPDEATLDAMSPESNSRTILSEEYIRLAHLIAEQRWSRDDDAERCAKDSALFSVGWEAALNNGGSTPTPADPDDPEKLTLCYPVMAKLLPHACQLIDTDIRCIAAGWNIEDALHGTPPVPGTEHGGMKRAAAEAWLRKHLSNPRTRARYAQRVTDWLGERLARAEEIRQRDSRDPQRPTSPNRNRHPGPAPVIQSLTVPAELVRRASTLAHLRGRVSTLSPRKVLS